MQLNSRILDASPEKGAGRESRPDADKTDEHLPPARKRIVGVYAFALLLALGLFYLHLVVIFDVIGEIIRIKPWLLEKMAAKAVGKLILLGCFFALLSVHVTQALVWGVFLRWARLLTSVTEGVYFSAVSITTLGYGDILLKYPWRHIGSLIAITGVLMFGCSTAFLFVVLQDVWTHLHPSQVPS